MERGGAQRVLLNLMEHYVSRDADVVLVNDFGLDSNVSQYNIPNKVIRYYLRDSLNGNKILKNIERVINLRKIVKKENPNVVLSFLGGCNKRMLISTIGIKTRKIVSIRNDPNYEYAKGGISKLFARNLFKLADGVVFQTKEASDYFPKRVVCKSTIILNPVDLKFYDAKRDNNPKNIIAIGRLSPQKNHKLLIEAYSKICDEFNDDDLIIYGEGSLREELLALCKELNIANRVSMLGNVDNVEQVLSKAKVFILTSNFEGMPNALMEAMAVGLPCISTDCPCGGPRMLIENDICGKLVKVNDADEAANALREVLNDENKQRFFGKNAKTKASEFKPSTILNKWDEFLFNGDIR